MQKMEGETVLRLVLKDGTQLRVGRAFRARLLEQIGSDLP